MSQKKYSPRIFLTFLFLVVVLSAVYAATIIRPLTGVGGESTGTGAGYHWGVFNTTDGNPGVIEFGLAPTNSGTYSGAALLSTTVGNTLSGYFWIGTIGWVNLQSVDFIPTGGAPTDPYTLSGWAWSDYAGWLDLSETGDVLWDPSNTTFSGYAWNDGIGWINMAGGTIAGTSSGLIGKVKILGNLGGEQVADTTYTIKSTAIQGTTMNDIINNVHQNVAVMLRNLPNSQKNNDFTVVSPNLFGQAIIFENTGSTNKYVSFNKSSILSKFNTNSVQSLIVIGGDVYLDDAVVWNAIWPSAWTDHPRSIIALKNDQGVGGNIYIHGNITRIMGSLIAEGSLYSVQSDTPIGSTALTMSSYVTNDVLNLPDRQLYINGSLISHNTIGGSYVNPPICPFTEINCTQSGAIKYDLNYFRDFQKSKPGASTLRGYKDASYDDYSVIVEYDARVLSDPPPGIEQMQ